MNENTENGFSEYEDVFLKLRASLPVQNSAFTFRATPELTILQIVVLAKSYLQKKGKELDPESTVTISVKRTGHIIQNHDLSIEKAEISNNDILSIHFWGIAD